MAVKKFNFIDFVIVAVVIFAVAAVCFMYGSKTDKDVSGDSANLTFTVEVTEVDRNYLDSIAEGDHVIFGTSSSDEAVVTGFEFACSRKLEKNTETGEFLISESDELYDAFITLSGSAVKTEDDIKIGSTAVKTGDTFEGKAKAAGESAKAYLIKGYVLDMSIGE